MWIRIHKDPEYGSNLDPDPQHCIILWLRSCIRGIDSLHCYVHTINVSYTFSNLIFCSKHSTWAMLINRLNRFSELFEFLRRYSLAKFYICVSALSTTLRIYRVSTVSRNRFILFLWGPRVHRGFIYQKGVEWRFPQNFKSVLLLFFFVCVVFSRHGLTKRYLLYQKGFFNLIGTFYYKIYG